MKHSLFRVAAAASVSLMLLTGCPAEERQETGTTTTTETAATGEAPVATGETAATGESAATGAGTTTVATVDAAAIFSQKCAGCHGANGGGGMGPALGATDEKGDEYIRNVIVNGSPEKGMPAFGSQLSEAEVTAMVNHVKSL